MRILTRYILKEVVSHALIGAALFTFVVFMRDVGRLLEIAVRNSAPLPSVAEIIFLTLPTALTVTIPMGVLVGILIGLSRMAADSEVTAMRAGGMGVWTFVRAVAPFVLAAWLLAVVNNVFIAPRSTAALYELQNELKTSQASFEVQPRVFYEEFKDYVLYVQDAATTGDAAVWRGVFLADLTQRSAPKIILAEEGVVVPESPTSLRIHLRNGTQHETNPRKPDEYSITTFQETTIPITLPQSESVRAPELVPASQLSTQELWQRSQHAERAPSVAASGRMPTDGEGRRRWYLTEFHRRLALPTACLVLALVGIPLGLSSHKGGKSTGFVLTLILVFLYYLLFLTGISMARQGRLGVGAAVWLGNLVFLLAGGLLLWRVDRMPIEIGSLGGLWQRMRRRVETRKERRQVARETGGRRRRVLASFDFPQILDDYVLREFSKNFVLMLAGLIVLLLVFTLFELLQDIFRNRVPAVTIVEYLINVIPYFMYQLTPLVVLLAVLVTFSGMMRTNEVTAMKATGISVYRAAFPVLATAGLFAISLFLFEQYYLPYANTRQETLRSQIKGKPAQTYLRPDRKWIFGQKPIIYFYEFYDPAENQFAGVSAFGFDPETFAITKRIYAHRAHWEPRLEKWVFENGWARNFAGASVTKFSTFDVNTFPEVTEPPRYFEKEVRLSSEMNYAELRRYIRDLQQSGFDVVRLRVQLHNKIAYPAITLVMAVLAVPFALSVGRRGALAGVAAAVGIAIGYMLIFRLFEVLGNVQYLPPALAAWSPDLIFGFAAGYLLFKVPT